MTHTEKKRSGKPSRYTNFGFLKYHNKWRLSKVQHHFRFHFRSVWKALNLLRNRSEPRFLLQSNKYFGWKLSEALIYIYICRKKYYARLTSILNEEPATIETCMYIVETQNDEKQRNSPNQDTDDRKLLREMLSIFT